MCCNVLYNNKTHQALSIATIPVINVDVVKDLDILVNEALSFSSHMCHIVTGEFARSNLIHKCFVSEHTPTLVRAFSSLSNAIHSLGQNIKSRKPASIVRPSDVCGQHCGDISGPIFTKFYNLA